MNGHVVVLVNGVNKLSCALVDAAKGGEGGDVQIQEGLGGQLGSEQVERAEGVCGGEGKSCRVLGAVERAAPLEVDGSSVEMFKVRCTRGRQSRHMCRDELGD